MKQKQIKEETMAGDIAYSPNNKQAKDFREYLKKYLKHYYDIIEVKEDKSNEKNNN